jgi:hypothetical protein
MHLKEKEQLGKAHKFLPFEEHRHVHVPRSQGTVDNISSGLIKDYIISIPIQLPTLSTPH